MTFASFARRLERQLNWLARPFPLTSLRVIGRIFMASILSLCLLWTVDTMQQRDALHLLTGGERALEQVGQSESAEGDAQPSPPTIPPKTQKSAGLETSFQDLLAKVLVIMRVPVLILVGILVPLGLFLWNWEVALYTRILKPYLMLLGAQAGSLIVGIGLLGDGIVPFIGTIYSILRVRQINELLRSGTGESDAAPRPLRLVLRTAQILWVFNWIALAIFVLWVLQHEFAAGWAVFWLALNLLFIPWLSQWQ